MMAITASVQNPADAGPSKPAATGNIKAAGTRLRRRLSKIFHRESTESGFFCGARQGRERLAEASG